MSKPISTSVMGAVVQYCGHRGAFIADLYVVAGACVVRASRNVSPDNLIRDEWFGSVTHHLVDFPTSGFWRPDLGMFVVPVKQVRVLAAEKAA